LVSIPQWNTNNYGSKGLAVNATATLFWNTQNAMLLLKEFWFIDLAWNCA
jgi:hypothetical protein